MPMASKHDLDDLRDRLAATLQARLGGHVDVGRITIPEGTGFSSETLLFDLVRDGESQPVVARLRPAADDYPVFREYDLGKQAQVMRLVAAETDVPVPEIIVYESDPSVLGEPFIIMARVEGEALCDMPPYTLGGSFLDRFSPAEHAEYRRNFVGILARLHRLDTRNTDLSFIAPVDGDTLGRQLSAQREYYAWACEGRDVPLITAGLDWLEAHRPTEPARSVLNWGDARPGNVLVAGTTPTAVLDWEMVDVGPAGVDVGWSLFLHRFFQHIAERLEVPGFPDLFPPETTLAEYVAAGGGEIADIEWYEVYASVRMATILVRTSLHGIAHGELPAVETDEELIHHRDLLRSQIGA
jgi:aminoglycoside phosphotransferase (APT) family kinase protein